MTETKLGCLMNEAPQLLAIFATARKNSCNSQNKR